MRIRTHLTSATLQQGGTRTEDDLDFGALALLFPTDPLIARDHLGWYLSATELDEADDRMDGSYRSVADRLLGEMNGAAILLRTGVVKCVSHVYDFQGKSDGQYVQISGVSLYTTSFDNLAPAAASALVQLAAQDDWVKRILDLFTHLDFDWIWVDLWRIWDVLKSFFAEPPSTEFRDWVAGLDASFNDLYYDFERSCNDPVFGPNRRHGGPRYRKRKNPATGLPGNMMSNDDATVFVKKVVVRWIERDHGLALQAQH